MFEMFPNFWTPVLPLSEIEASPVAVELAGETLVLFRNSVAKIGALLDRCPHRGAALSLGRMTESGDLECPYHGWQFDVSGTCNRVPLNNLSLAQLSKLSAVSLPTKIIAGLVWIFTGQGEVPDPVLPSTLSNPTQKHAIYHEVWNAHWTRVMENVLDNLHVPFVHRNSFGQAMNQMVETNAVLQLNVAPTDFGLVVAAASDNGPFGFELEWYQPNCTVLKFDRIGMPYRGHFFAVPMTQQRTRLFLVHSPISGMESYQDDFRWSKIGLAEDRRVIESQVGEVPEGSKERHIPTDQATLRFRRWYHQEVNL